MLNLYGPRQRFCDGVSRRDFLRAGVLGVAGLTLADLCRLGAAERSRPRAVIMVCLPGGPSHLETYDMKPDAPEDIRGEFRPIQTNVPGVHISEYFPLQARMADKFAVVRNLRFQQPDHQLHEIYTGFPEQARRPAFGSVVSRLRHNRSTSLPSYISLALSDHPRTVARAEQPHRPFEPTAQFLQSLGAALSQVRERRGILRAFDNMRRELDSRGEMEAMDAFTARAFDMLTAPEVRDAFDLEKEPLALRERYGQNQVSSFNYQFGHTWHGSNFLLARRLVEAGVPVVTLGEMGWDHHGNLNGVRGTIFERSREQLPWLDRSLHALVTDLHERGLERDVAVVVWGEFGRTPRVNRFGGRDHWTPAGFAWFAGGGFRTGQAIGSTDAHGSRPVGPAYTPQNVLATLYRHLGIEPSTTLADFTGRPQFLLEQHEGIRGLES